MGTHARLLFCWLCLQVIFATVLSDVWKAEVVSELKALVSSCVVLPCKFQYPGKPLPDSRIRGIWHKQDKHDQRLYHEDPIEIADNFKGRTRLLGHLGEKNCTLEIDEVRNHDHGPFCFRAEIPTIEKYSFVESCVALSMMPAPEKPKLEQMKTLEDGVPATFKCSIRHTCPSHPPTITWSRSNSEATWSNRDILHGNWEMESLLIFIPTEKDDFTDLTCTVSFHGGLQSSVSSLMLVKRKSSWACQTGERPAQSKANFLHIIIPVVAVLGTSLLFGGVFYIMCKKYRRQIQDLQSRNASVYNNY
ncbi:sialic acid-binding Ig-like lectin 14 [Pygocentrus nattereri]|uniref:sialic acid-binding Ig-like lectin 14 n=1 Tax=Pygocentrus nattereri TaxID=42514 RepID=UPI001890BE13|nr:sialic acid-binding Ig-like lectin 14 [Pygocentrus nattereri]